MENEPQINYSKEFNAGSVSETYHHCLALKHKGKMSKKNKYRVPARLWELINGSLGLIKTLINTTRPRVTFFKS